MKKFFVAVLVVSVVFMFAGTSHARGIMVKGGYGIMMDDYDDADYDNRPFFGLYFDAGNFIFNNLKFKAGVDYMAMKSDRAFDFDVWGIHLDWYWFFMGKSQINPFLGFGPALNYYDFDNDVEDSDAGIEGFAGVEFNLSGPLSLMLEARYLWHDIADRDTTVFKLGVGVQYNF